MKTIRLWFSDFWHEETEHAIRQYNPLFRLLQQQFDIVLEQHTPDFLLYSCFGERFYDYRCPRILYLGENIRPNWNECDYAFTFDYTDNPHHYRLPLFALQSDARALSRHAIGATEADTLLKEKNRFCNFIYSHANCRERNDFFHRLSTYKPVDAAGKLFNNTPPPSPRKADNYIEAKVQFIRRYKFTIAFESMSYPGYTTEKLADALVAHTVPIYYGNPLVARDFNSKAFINCHDFASWQEVINKVIEIDQNDEMYKAYLREPPYPQAKIPTCANLQYALTQFTEIFAAPPAHPVAFSAYNQWMRLMPRFIRRKKRKFYYKRRHSYHLPCTLY